MDTSACNFGSFFARHVQRNRSENVEKKKFWSEILHFSLSPGGLQSQNHVLCRIHAKLVQAEKRAASNVRPVNHVKLAISLNHAVHFH
jgi:hypothetical protein